MLCASCEVMAGGTNKAMTSLTLGGNSADPPLPILRPWPAPGHHAGIRDG